MEGRSGSVEEAEKTRLVETFLGITAATREEAVFFLESHDWILDSAILSFYDDHSDPHHDRRRQPLPQTPHDEEDPDGEDDDQDEDYTPPAAAAVAPPPRVTRSSSAAPAAALATRSSAAMGSRADKKPAKPSGSRPTIRTLADLNRSSGPGSDSDSDGPQEYYTGGEKSGMLVQDPSKGGNDVDAIFEQARQMGAMQGPFEPHQQSSSSRSFTGTGRLLSGESVESAPAPQQAENVVHDIYFWRNGFTVNDGPLRRFDDPDNASFLESIRKSECPKELEPADRRSMVHVNLMRRDENCPEPVRRLSPFQGVGRTLGGGSSDSSATEPTAGAAASSTVPSSVGLSVDASLPSTSIQLRLADGTRMVARFNTHHTVGDIRAFIDASRPGSARTYQLQTVGFPPKQLNDVSKTIEELGLANSVIIQKG